MKHLLIIFSILLIHFGVRGQDTTRAAIAMNQRSEIKYDELTLGIGLGIDHGGIGANLCGYPLKDLGIFGGFGYALAGVGLEAGVKYRFISKDKFTKWAPFVEGMYGYNAAIAVTNAQEYNKLFYGPTFGAGVTFRPNPLKSGGLHMALLIPVRGSDVDEYISELKTKGVVFKNELIPFAISVAYITVLK